MKKKLLLVSKLVDAKPFLPLFERQGLTVHQFESFKDALKDAKEWKPGVIVFLVPVYWESIVDFVKEVREIEEMKKTEILYIGKLIEGAELTYLRKYEVKTMALGPVPTEEISRFIYNLFPAW